MELAQIDIGEIWKLSGRTGKGGFSSLSDLVSSLLPKVLIFGGIIFFAIIVITGFGIVTKAGSADAQAMESRKNILTYALIGFIIMFGSYWILQIVNFITGGALGGAGGNPFGIF